LIVGVSPSGIDILIARRVLVVRIGLMQWPIGASHAIGAGAFGSIGRLGSIRFSFMR
jgi:hypothetical protein